jgi:WD40 repeat protein
MEWSPDSRTLVAKCGGHDGFQFLSVPDAQVQWARELPAIHAVFHPDGSFWYLDYNDNTLWRVDLSKRTAEYRLLNACDPAQNFSISPDGKRIAVAWGGILGKEVMVLDTTTGQRVGHLSDQENLEIRDMRFTSDGKWLLTAHSPGTKGSVKVWNLATCKLEYTIQDVFTLFFNFDNIALSPDGKYLAARSLEGKRQIWSLEARAWVWKKPEENFSSKMDPGVFSGDSKEFWTKAPMVFKAFGEPQGGLQRWKFLN